MTRPYHSQRIGLRPPTIDTEVAKRLFLATWQRLRDDGYFHEAFGFYCTDRGPVEGAAGRDVGAFVFRRTLRDGLWPIEETCTFWSEDQFFDAIEFLFDHVSKPKERDFHDWNQCGWHYSNFDKPEGQADYRNEVNETLQLLDGGWELSSIGEILQRFERSVMDLLNRPLPNGTDNGVQDRLAAAVLKFRRRASSRDDRRDAVRDLADILEVLRPRAKSVLTKKDDALLFDMVNNFGIRHFNDRQRTDYDPIWLAWMFHFFLATIHAVIRLLAQLPASPSTDTEGVPGG